MFYNKPFYIGFGIFKFSQNYHYSKYCENVNLCYTDTDSLVILIHTFIYISRNIWYALLNQIIKQIISKIPKTTSVIRKMNDDYAGNVPRSFMARTCEIGQFRKSCEK